MKLSYSCMTNIKTIINNHNHKIISKHREIEVNSKENKPNNKKNKKETNEIKTTPSSLKTKKQDKCNCKKYECPLKDSKFNCRTKNVIYKATVETQGKKNFYIGLTSMEIKKRIQGHLNTFKDQKKKDATALSELIWTIKENKKNYTIKWEIIKRTNERKNGDKTCRLCDMEVLEILEHKKRYKDNCLNKKTEITNSCRHHKKYLLSNWNEDENIQ